MSRRRSSPRTKRDRPARADGVPTAAPPRPGRTEGMKRFLSEYTAGLSTREVRRLFQRDAVEAYSVLTRDHAEEQEPRGGLKGLLTRVKVAFLGLSYKLTPARRMLFALSLLSAVLAMVMGSWTYDTVAGHHVTRISIDFSPLWFLVSIGCLLLLLALELVDRIRVRDELEVARELQAELLPHGTIEVPGYACAHSYRTANEVGGDYYEVSTLPDGRVAIMVGDATGHGMAAGLVMAIANATLKTAMDLDPDPRHVLRLLNRTLFRTGSRRAFMTVFYALLTPATGEVVAISAGHPYPLLRRAGGRIEELGTPGLPLGVRADLAPEPQTTTLEPGDMLLLYTDGLAEAVDRRTDAFGYERIAALTAPGGPVQTVHDRILTAFDAHVGDEPLRDDLTLLVIARTAAGAAPAAIQGAAPAVTRGAGAAPAGAPSGPQVPLPGGALATAAPQGGAAMTPTPQGGAATTAATQGGATVRTAAERVAAMAAALRDSTWPTSAAPGAPATAATPAATTDLAAAAAPAGKQHQAAAGHTPPGEPRRP